MRKSVLVAAVQVDYSPASGGDGVVVVVVVVAKVEDAATNLKNAQYGRTCVSLIACSMLE